MLCFFQEGEEGKEDEEKENLGKLEYSLDYNFTDNQVHPIHTPARSILQAHTNIKPPKHRNERINEPKP